jgi:uncharacterized LabA/DUF88 family protein
MSDREPRLAVFLDYENLAIGARENLRRPFDFGHVADAMAERGRVVARFAYADWSYFEEDRRRLTRHNVELIELPQKMGASRKNAADIKMAVDAIEMAFEREFVTTFVICTGDSDFTPLVQKLRALDKQVIGVGVRGSTSALLPPACDEFLFYDRLVGDIEPDEKPSRPAVETADDVPVEPTDADPVIVIQTLAGLLRSSDGPVRASSLKRAILRKDPTFSEVDYGTRGFGELLRRLEADGLVELEGRGDPEVSLPSGGSAAGAFALLATVAGERSGGIQLSGAKTAMRKHDPDFSERRLGYGSFLQFCRDAAANGAVSLEADGDGYLLSPAT